MRDKITLNQIDIVVGLCYGDEGKGVTTKFLAKKALEKGHKPIVVRFGGGNQVGHGVYIDQTDEVHSHHHLTSGVTEGVEGYYTEYCTVDPIGFNKEYTKLASIGISPRITFHPKVMLVTPMDVMINRNREEKNQHSSVGVGFGTTIERNEHNYHLWVSDAIQPEIFKEKYYQIINFWKDELTSSQIDIAKSAYENYLVEYKNFEDRIDVNTIRNLILESGFNHLIFEGHQGVLLDMEYGVFPYVTRSKTTPYNAGKILAENNITAQDIHTYGVLRSYATRHGNGGFKDQEVELNLSRTHWETNQENKYQGSFRYGLHTKDSIERALACCYMDLALFTDMVDQVKNNLDMVITCVDQFPIQGELLELLSSMHNKYYINMSPRSELEYIDINERSDITKSS